MRKRFMIMFNVVLCLIGLSPVLAASDIDNGGLSYSLSANESVVLEGNQIAFVFKYNSTDNLEALQAASGSQVTLDFSQLVTSDEDIEYSIGSEVFTTEVSDGGVVTLTVNDFTSQSESLTNVSGIGYFYVRTKDVEEDTFATVTSSFGSNIGIELQSDQGYINNSDLQSDLNYVNVGDTVRYQILVNGSEDYVSTIDVHTFIPDAMTYVPGSFEANEVNTWKDVSNQFSIVTDTAGGSIVRSEKPFDTQLLLSFEVEVNEAESNYLTRTRVTYNGRTVDKIEHLIDFKVGYHSEVKYNHGVIEITNIDQNDKPVANAEFDIVDENGTVVDHVVTDKNGLATTSHLAFGKYTVQQTNVENGYTLTEPKEVVIPFTASNSVTAVSFKNKATKPVDKLGAITIKNISDSGEPIAGATIQIVDSNGKVVEELTTDSNGNAVSTDLPLGTYSVIVTEVPEGYNLETGDQSVALTTTAPEATVEVVAAEIEEDKEEGNFIEVHVTNSSGDDLAGISFGIYDQDGNLVEVIVTDENGNAQSQVLEDGDYYIMKLDDDNNPSGDQYWVDLGANNVQMDYVVDTTPESDSNSPDTTTSDTSSNDDNTSNSTTSNSTTGDMTTLETANTDQSEQLVNTTDDSQPVVTEPIADDVVSDQITSTVNAETSGSISQTGSNFGLLLIGAIVVLGGLVTLKVKAKK